MKSKKIIIGALAVSTALALAGCSGGGSSQVADKAPSHLSGTISLWHHYSDREAQVIQSVVNDFEKANPDVKVQVRSAQQDTKITQVVATSSNVTS